MGCDINCVLQKKNDKGEWITIDDCLLSRDYEVFTWLSGVRGMAGKYDEIAEYEFPDDFKYKEQNGVRYHNGIYMGEHSFGHISMSDLIDAHLPDAPNLFECFNIQKHETGINIEFPEAGDDEAGTYDSYRTCRLLQEALSYMYGYDASQYRFVFGYDS